MCARLDREYFDAVQGARICAAMRTDGRAGRFDQDSMAHAFARNLTARLRAASRNRHLDVLFIPEDAPPPKPETWRAPFRRNGVGESRLLSGNIAYIELLSFTDPQRHGGEIDSVMRTLSEADALIFDLRQNTGGNPWMVAHLLSWLVAGRQPLVAGFRAFLSTGDVRNIVTGENWEATGILSEVVVRSVDRVEFARRLLLQRLGRDPDPARPSPTEPEAQSRPSARRQ